MSSYDDRLTSLQDLARDAETAMRDLGDDAWPSGEMRERCLGVFAYARVVLESSDGALLSDQAFQLISNAISQFSGSPAQAAQNADPWSSALIDAVGALPVARDRAVEQAVKDAAANFQRSAQQRLNSFDQDVAAARAELETLKTTIDTRKTELATVLDERKSEIATEIETLQTAFEEKLAAFEAQLESEKARLATLRTSQTTAFDAAEEQRSAAAKERVAKADAELEEFQKSAKAEVEARVAEIRRMETESAQLVGAIGLAGTAERYGEEVDDQKSVANFWRWVTVGLALLAVGGVVVAVAEKDPVAETFAGKLALSAILGGIAAYAARQSAYHRRREQRARDLQLELTAFAPFIEPLSTEQQEEERVIMTRKTFGKTTAVEKHAEEPGPTPLSFLLRRKEREATKE